MIHYMLLLGYILVTCHKNNIPRCKNDVSRRARAQLKKEFLFYSIKNIQKKIIDRGIDS